MGAEKTATELLTEWFDWWYNDPTSPVKMPDALHVRTATFLISEGIADEKHRAVAKVPR